MVTRRQVLGGVAAIAATRFVPMRVAYGQDATPVAGQSILARFLLDELPGPPDPGVEAWFFRLTGEPGAGTPFGPDAGAMLTFVEQGEVTHRYAGTVRLRRAGSDAEETLDAPESTPAELRLLAGDAVLSVTGNRSGLENTGAIEARVLMWVVMSPIEESAASGEESDDTDVPFLPDMIAVGGGTLPTGPGAIAIERVTIAPNAAAPAQTHADIENVGVEAGSLTISVIGGEVRQWPGVMAIDIAAAERAAELGTPPAAVERPRDVQVGPGQTVELVANDGYMLAAGSEIAWTAGPDGATLLLARCGPGDSADA